MKKIIILGLGLVLLAAACNKSADQTNNTTPPPAATPPPTTTPPATPPAVISGQTEIDITSSGFNPSNVTIKKGTQVTFKNADSKAHWPASDPHPSHVDLSGFDALKGLVSGETYVFTFSKVGTWGAHDHLNPAIRGTITVVE